MAKLQEEVIVIKLSKLVKDTEDLAPLVNDEFVASLEAIVQELAGNSTLVEIQPVQ